MKVLVSTKDMSLDDWLKWRRKGIGGSDAPVILGKSSFGSPIDVWLQKTGQAEETEDNENMYWGRVLEDIVAKEFTRRTGKKLRRRNAILQHDDYPFLLANVDRLVVGEDSGFEAKTTSAWYQGNNEDCPDYYKIQAMHYLAVTGLSTWYIAVLSGGQKFYIYTIKRDDNYINNVLIPAEEKFWGYVTSGEMPPADGSESCAKVLNDLYPEATEDEIELPEDAYELLQEYDELKEQADRLKQKMDLIANTVKQEMGENSRAHIFDRKVMWTNVTSNKFDSKKFREENPEMYARYVKETSYRRFQIK